MKALSLPPVWLGFGVLNPEYSKARKQWKRKIKIAKKYGLKNANYTNSDYQKAYYKLVRKNK